MFKDLKNLYDKNAATTSDAFEVFQKMLQTANRFRQSKKSSKENSDNSRSLFSITQNTAAFSFDDDFKINSIQGNSELFLNEIKFQDTLIESFKFKDNLQLECLKYLDQCRDSFVPIVDQEIIFGSSLTKILMTVFPYFVNGKSNYAVILELQDNLDLNSSNTIAHNEVSTPEVLAAILTDNKVKDEVIVEQHEQLTASRTYSESIMQTVREALLILDKNFRIITANDAFHRCFDTTHEEIIANNFFEINDAQWNIEELRILFGQILPKHQVIESYKLTLSLGNKKKRTLMLNARQIVSEDKTDNLILVAIEDITKSKLLKTERDFSKTLEIKVADKTRELQQSQAFLNSILDSTKYGISSYEAIFEDSIIVDFLITYSNAEVPQMFELTVDQVIGKTCKDVYPNIFNDGTFEKLVHCVEQDEIMHYEFDYQKGEDTIWISSVASKVENSVTVTSKIITTEKKAALNLKLLNEQLTARNTAFEERLLAEFSDSFKSFKTGKEFFDSLVLELAQKTEMDTVLLGELVQEENGKYIRCFSVASKGEIANNFKYKVTEGPCSKILKGAPYLQTHAVRELFPNNQTLIDFNAEGYLGYPLFDQKNKCIGLISVLHQSKIENIGYIKSFVHIASRRIELELQRQINEKILEDKNRELQYNNRELQSFNYIASHDLQEPLRKIQLFTGRILETDEDNFSDLSVKYFITIRNAAGRMQNLIQALLTYSTSDAKGMEFKKTNLNSIVEDIKTDLEDKIQISNTTIISDDLPTLSVIPSQFHQLLQNLIANAIKYQNPGIDPVITITAELFVENETDSHKMWKICVSDNGIGFEKQYKDKIFELFQRLHGKNEYEGTGIGLAICKKIIQNHKGYIKVDSELGKGSNFCIFVPSKN